MRSAGDFPASFERVDAFPEIFEIPWRRGQLEQRTSSFDQA
jgi:hypothetical protein